MYVSKLFLERFDYVGYHGHELNKVDSIEWFFHNKEHGYKHCKGGKANPYEVVHVGKKHGISTQYARGHGRKVKPTWFKFTKKLNSKYWDLSSGKVIDVKTVPITMKFNMVK